MRDVVNSGCGAEGHVAVSAVARGNDARWSSASAGMFLAALVVYAIGVALEKTTGVAILVLSMVTAAVGIRFWPFRA